MTGIQIKTTRRVGVADKHIRCTVTSLPKTNVIHVLISLKQVKFKKQLITED